jgi:hypothetical protein
VCVCVGGWVDGWVPSCRRPFTFMPTFLPTFLVPYLRSYRSPQAISMMGMKGVAMKVEFNPVRAEDVVLPEGGIFVVANSLAVSSKAVGAHRR